jgi:hypothetical protein
MLSLRKTLRYLERNFKGTMTLILVGRQPFQENATKNLRS